MFENAIDRLTASGRDLSIGELTTVLTILNNDFRASLGACIGPHVSFLMKEVDVFAEPVTLNVNIGQLVYDLLQKLHRIDSQCQRESDNSLSKALLRVFDALAERIHEVDPTANFSRLRRMALGL